MHGKARGSVAKGGARPLTVVQGERGVGDDEGTFSLKAMR
jgi:hypothetical protein